MGLERVGHDLVTNNSSCFIGYFCKYYTYSCCIVAKSCLCNPMDSSLPGSVRGISQARIPDWVAISFSSGSSQPMDLSHVSCIDGGFFTTEPPGKPPKKDAHK